MKNTLLTNSLLVLLTVLTAASCTKYNISGTSSLEGVDGHMLYLKGISNDEIVNLDSCEVVHGKFKFSGSLDSIQVVTLCIDNDPILPVVLEDGEVIVELNEQRQQCKGTPLNDTLSAFNKRYEILMQQFDDLTHQQSQAIMNGDDMDAVNQRLAEMEHKLVEEEDRMMHMAADMINRTIAIPCTGCSYCTVNCPMNIAIPRYFSLYNAEMQEVPEKGWTPQSGYYDRLTLSFGKASDCLKCGQCEAMCPQHLPIRKYLEIVAEKFEG